MRNAKAINMPKNIFFVISFLNDLLEWFYRKMFLFYKKDFNLKFLFNAC